MNHDLCGKCIKTLNSNVEDYFEIENTVPDMVFHEYFECDSCHTKPIWGIRFHCLECPNLDLCEGMLASSFRSFLPALLTSYSMLRCQVSASGSPSAQVARVQGH